MTSKQVFWCSEFFILQSKVGLRLGYLFKILFLRHADQSILIKDQSA